MKSEIHIKHINLLTSKRLIIYGCGLLSVEFVENYLETIRLYNIKSNIYQLIDKDVSNKNINQIIKLLKLEGISSIPKISQETEMPNNESHVIITVASDPTRRNSLYNKLKENGFNMASYIHHSSYISPLAEIGEGTILFRNTYIGANTRIGNNVFINNDTSVAHDSVIGQSSVVCPRVNISGNSYVGNECFIATGAILDNESKLGDNSQVSALSFYTKKKGKDNYIYFGNPAKGLPRLKST